MVDGWIELQDELRTERALRTLIIHKPRGSAFLRGRHEYKIDDDGLPVFPRLETQVSHIPVPGTSTDRLPTGIEALDDMIGGGISERSSTVVLGPTGNGKTTVAMQFLGECTPEERVLMFGFYETPDRLARKAASVGVDLGALQRSGAVDVVWQPPLENLIDDLGQGIVGAVRRTGARRVVIDGINALQRPPTFPGRIHAFLRALDDILRGEGATTIYTREVPQLFFPEALAIEELSGTIDNTIILHYTLDGNAVRRRVSVLKIRDSDFDHISQEFEVTAGGIALRSVDGHDSLAATTAGATVVAPSSSSAGGGRVR